MCGWVDGRSDACLVDSMHVDSLCGISRLNLIQLHPEDFLSGSPSVRLALLSLVKIPALESGKRL